MYIGDDGRPHLRILNPHVPKAVISAVQFAELTKSGGGATMDVHTFDVAKPGESKVFVGGEPNVGGRRIRTKHVDLEHLDMPTVLKNAARIREKTGGRPNASLGSWDPKDGRKVMLDAVGEYPNEDAAQAKAYKRNEEGIYNMAKDTGKGLGDGYVENPAYNPKKRQK